MADKEKIIETIKVQKNCNSQSNYCDWCPLTVKGETCESLTDKTVEMLTDYMRLLEGRDKLKAEIIEARNSAESLVYNCQKTLDELGDTISGEEKAKAEAEIENVKKALEGSDTEAIKSATEKLTTVFYSISEKLYSANAANGAAEGAQTAGPNVDENGNVYDADYKVEYDSDNK